MLSRLVTLHPGDQVTSSGDGGLLPAGLPIGTVVPDNNGGYRVALLADAASSQDVEILNFSKPPEELPATAQLPVEAAGLKPQVPQPPPTPVSPLATAPVPPKPTTPTTAPTAAAPKPDTPPADTTGEPADMDR
jgi:rod shape-determining protein MreC